VCAAEEGRCYLGEGDAAADNYYSTKQSLAADNSVALYDGERIVDKVGWGKAADFEGSAYIPDTAAGKNFGRKTIEGVMADTQDNAKDFFAVSMPSPQNSLGQVVVSGASGGNISGVESGEMDGVESGETDTAAENAPVAADEAGLETGMPAETEIEMTEEGNSSNSLSNTASNKEQDDGTAAAGPSGSLSVSGEKNIVITEIMISPLGDDKTAEFVEIFNAGSAAVDLSGWSLEDQAGSASKYIFPEVSFIAAGEYLVLYSAVTKLSLNNSGDGVILKDETEKTIFKTPLSDEAEENISFAEENGKWHWSAAPTPGSRNIIKEIGKESPAKKEEIVKNEIAEAAGSGVNGLEQDAVAEDSAEKTSYDFADGVIISEIFPDPIGRDNKEENYEWVEIYNENDRSVDLRGWCLDDVLEKGSKMFCFAESKIVAAQSYLVVASSESRLALNNTAEDINLLWPDKRVVDTASYEKTKEGFSYSLGADGAWRWTKMATPGAANILAKEAGTADVSLRKNEAEHLESGQEQESGAVLGSSRAIEGEYETMSIAEARDLPLGSLVETGGLVSVPYGVLGEDILYIMDDAGDGIRITGSSEDLPALLLGDEIRVLGRLGEAGGEKYLLVIGLVQKMSGDNLLESHALDFINLAGSLGSLVSIKGEVNAVADNSLFYLKAAEGEMKIYAEPETGISFADIDVGKKLEITGILSRTSLGYRILPRFLSDIRFLEENDSGIMGKSDKVAIENRGVLRSFVWFLPAAFLFLFSRPQWTRARNGLYGLARKMKGMFAGQKDN